MTRSIRTQAGSGAAFLAGMLTLALGGCTTQVAIPPTVGCNFTPKLTAPLPAGPALAEPAGVMTPVPLNSVSMTDPAITNKVAVQSINAARNASGTVLVMARLVNCTDFPLQVEGRTNFLDQAQRPTEPVSAWQRVHLPARAIGMYQESSTDVKSVQSYLIELREGH